MSEAGTISTPETPSTESLREQAVAVKEDVRKLGRLTREISQKKLRETKHVADEYVAKGRQKAGAIEESAVTYIRENPVKSVLIAAGAGTLVGFLFSRR